MDMNSVGVADNSRSAEIETSVSNGLRLLWVGPEEPSWIGMALRLDAEGLVEPRFRWAQTSADALAVLRVEAFDCVLIGEDRLGTSPRIADDPSLLVQAVRGSGYSDPVIFITATIDDYRLAELCELDCDVLATPNSYDSPALLPFIRRTVAHAERRRENQRLSVVQQRRLQRDRSEAEQLLQQQRSIITKLDSAVVRQNLEGEAVAAPSRSSLSELPEEEAAVTLPVEMGEFYHELLRTFVMMGSGSLATDIAGFAHLLATARISLRQALQFHLERVESLVRDLGSRSTRHVMARADLLALELMVHLGEEYRQVGRLQPVGHHRPPQ